MAAIGWLRLFAWLNLLGGIIAAIYVWSTMGARVVTSPLADYSFTEANPLGISLGIALFVEGVFGCAFLLVICLIAENTVAIRRNTEREIQGGRGNEAADRVRKFKCVNPECGASLSIGMIEIREKITGTDASGKPLAKPLTVIYGHCPQCGEIIRCPKCGSFLEFRQECAYCRVCDSRYSFAVEE